MFVGRYLRSRSTVPETSEQSLLKAWSLKCDSDWTSCCHHYVQLGSDKWCFHSVRFYFFSLLYCKSVPCILKDSFLVWKWACCNHWLSIRVWFELNWCLKLNRHESIWNITACFSNFHSFNKLWSSVFVMNKALELKIITYYDIATFQDNIVKLHFQFIHCLVLAWLVVFFHFPLLSMLLLCILIYSDIKHYEIVSPNHQYRIKNRNYLEQNRVKKRFK